MNRRLRIVLANSFHYPRGGDSTQYLDILGTLEDRGHEVAAFSMRHPDNFTSPWERYWIPNVEYRGDLSVQERLRAAVHSTYSVNAARAMSRLLRDFRPDIVHLHSVHHHLTVSVVRACVRRGVPVVWTLHDYRTVCPATSLLRDLHICERCAGGGFWHGVVGRCKGREWTRSTAAVAESYFTAWTGVLGEVACYIAPSRFLARKALAMGLPARRMAVLPNAVNLRSGPRCEETRSGLLYVGRLSEEKGLDVLVAALTRLSGARLTVVGDGPHRSRLETMVDEARLPVTFLGWQDRAAVTMMMAKAEALCVPSICYENCPGVVLEAMVAGLPVVASDLGGLREILDGGRAGWLAKAGDVDDWARCVGAALVDEEASRLRVRQALERVTARHSPLRFVEKLESIYASLI